MRLEQMALKAAPIDTPDNPAYPNHSDTDIFIRGFMVGYNANQQADKLAEALRSVRNGDIPECEYNFICNALTEYENSK